MKKLLILLLVFTLAVTLLVGCSPKDEPDIPNDDGSTDVGGEKTPTRLPTPTVYISDKGLASWNEIPGAVSYIVQINGSGRYQTGNSYQLRDEDTICVAAVGDGENYINSYYSVKKTYHAEVTPEAKTIKELNSAPTNRVYEIIGYVCAVGKANLLLTDNDGGYLYVYTAFEHDFNVGDEIRIVGTKVDYWNAYELKDISEAFLLSKDNEISVPTLTEADGEFFAERLNNFRTGEYVQVSGKLIVSNNYYNFEIENLDNALLSLIYRGEPLEYGKTYTVTGYTTYISGESNKYINIMITEIEPFSPIEKDELCPICGDPLDEGNHEELDCGHFACDSGNHNKLDCNHYACDGKDHEKLNCNHYACDGKVHAELDCGHFACDSGEHNKLTCGHYSCDGKDHAKLNCGHFTCEGGDHSECEYCGEYLCTGNHSECGKPQIIYCDNCGKDVSIGDHNKLDCGHFACDSGNHNKLDCNHYACDGKNHAELDCGHFACDSGNHNKLDCNHYACDGKNHAELDCGHFACDSGNHNKLNCNHYACDGKDHAELDCGHFACDSGEHNKLDCNHYACDGKDHEKLNCNHYVCDGKDHAKLNCGHYSCDGKDHAKLNCGHFVCDGNTHSPCEICGELLCIGNHGDGVCVKISTFPEIYEGENESIFTTEGIVCAIGAYELMITDNKGNYIHVGFADVHPYTVGTCIRITGYKFGFGNISYDLVPIEIEVVYSGNNPEYITPIKVDRDYFVDSAANGYKMGEYISFTGSLDRDTDCFIVDGVYVGVVWTGIEVFYNTKYTVTAYVYYLDSIDGYWVMATNFKAVTNEPDPEPEICPACGRYLLIGDHYLQDCGHYICLGAHELLACGHYSCDDGNHESCSWCGKYICHGGSHSRCYACGGATCDGNYHDICSICGWYLCKGNHSLLECGHRACEGGEHYKCGVCGEYLCHGGDHYELYCGHFVCDGGIHKICPSCHEPTCNGPDHELCEYCSDHVCTGTHKLCPACGESTCNKPDHPICGGCGNYKCICDCEPEENNNKFVTEFLYSVSYQEFEDVVYCDKGDESRPLIRLISYTYEAYYNFMVSFEPLDDNTFIIEAYVEGYQEDGTFLHLTIYTFTGIQTLMDDGRYAVEFVTFTNMVGEDIMKYHGTYFPKTRIAIISVDRVSMSFEIPTMLAFILGEKFEVPEIYAPCYYCGETIVPGEVNLHVNTCTHCGKQFCEGGVEAHYFYNDTTYDPALGPYAEHFPVSEEDIRTNLLTRIEIEINGGVIIPGTERDEEEEEEEE